MSTPYVPGWIDDQQAVVAVQNTLPFPVSGTTDAGNVAMDDIPAETFLWNYAKKVLGKHIPAHNQLRVGICVGEGFSAAVEYIQCVEISQGEPEEFLMISCESIYALSRVEIGGGRIGGDGSVGAWAAKAVTDYGCLARKVYGSVDLTQYSEQRARDWGRSGLPNDLESTAKNHLIKTVTQVNNFNDARRMIAQGYPVAVCSDRGFRTTRDKDGFCSPLGVWNHCMLFIAQFAGSRPGLTCLQSWGDDSPDGPIGIGDHPPNAFHVDADVADKMLRQGDSWALSAFAGFPARKLTHLI